MRAIMLASIMLAATVAGCLEGSNPGVGDDDDVAMPMEGRPTWVLDASGNIVDAAKFPGELPEFDQVTPSQRVSGEPTIAVTRTHAVFYPAIEFDQTGNLPQTHFMRSLDGGETWEEKSPDAGNVARTHPYSFDPYVYADPQTGRVFALDMGPHVACNHVSWSDNDGNTWTTQYFTCPGVPVNDHPTLFAGPPMGLPTVGYPNNVYLCTNAIGESHCFVSRDGGLTWNDGVPAYTGAQQSGEGDVAICGGLTGHGHASWADGTVYLPRASCGIPEVAVSRDGGLTFEVIQVAPDEDPGTRAHDTMIATDANGTAYYLYLCGPDDNGACLKISHDQGRTWSEAINVTAPGVTATKLPSITAGSDGRIAFLYVGTTTPSGWQAHHEDNADELRNTTWNAYVGVSLNADSDDPTFAITTINDLSEPIKRGGCTGRCFGDIGGMYDFFDIDINPMTGRIWAAIVDVCTGECDWDDADADTFQRTFGAVGRQVGGSKLLTEPIPDA